MFPEEALKNPTFVDYLVMVTMALTKGRRFPLLNLFGNVSTESFIGNETVLIFFGAGLLEHWDNFFLLKSLTEGDKDVFEFSVQHGAVVLLVVKLEHLHEVLVGATVLVLLDLGVKGEELVDLELLGLLHLLHAQLFQDGDGWVEVEGPHAVTQVESVHGVITFKIVDGEGELCPFDVSGAEVRHCDGFFLRL